MPRHSTALRQTREHPADQPGAPRPAGALGDGSIGGRPCRAESARTTPRIARAAASASCGGPGISSDARTGLAGGNRAAFAAAVAAYCCAEAHPRPAARPRSRMTAQECKAWTTPARAAGASRSTAAAPSRTSWPGTPTDGCIRTRCCRATRVTAATLPYAASASCSHASGLVRRRSNRSGSARPSPPTRCSNARASRRCW